MQLTSADSWAESISALDAAYLPAAIVTRSGNTSPFLLLGDHAGREVPPALAQLGLPEADLARHIGWDIGVSALGQRLAGSLDATFISQRYSRLVIDCNRDPMRADAIPEISDGTVVPGNLAIGEHERSARIASVFKPYHDRIATELDARAALGIPTIVVALHSFTPVIQEFQRPWQFGVLHLGGSAFSDAMLARLRSEPDGPMVGDNEPYRMDGIDFTVPYHAIGRGLDYVELEVRQDLMTTEAGQQAVAERLTRVLPAALGDCAG